MRLPYDQEFTRYGPSHWAVLTVFAIGAWFLIRQGRCHRDTASGQRFCRLFGWVLLINQLFFQIYSMLPSQWDIRHSLPFHLSDLAAIVAIYTLWTRNPWGFALLYYWGLTLTPQAFITPVLDRLASDPLA